MLLFEPYISLASWPAYGWFHHEPVGWRRQLDLADTLPRPRAYYAAQGNATRLFFRKQIPNWPGGWTIFHAEAFSCFHYLLAGGYSKPALYPRTWLPALRRLDRWLSRLPRVFGGRCLVSLAPC